MSNFSICPHTTAQIEAVREFIQVADKLADTLRHGLPNAEDYPVFDKLATARRAVADFVRASADFEVNEYVTNEADFGASLTPTTNEFVISDELNQQIKAVILAYTAGAYLNGLPCGVERKATPAGFHRQFINFSLDGVGQALKKELETYLLNLKTVI